MPNSCLFLAIFNHAESMSRSNFTNCSRMLLEVVEQKREEVRGDYVLAWLPIAVKDYRVSVQLSRSSPNLHSFRAKRQRLCNSSIPSFSLRISIPFGCGLSSSFSGLSDCARGCWTPRRLIWYNLWWQTFLDRWIGSNFNCTTLLLNPNEHALK